MIGCVMMRDRRGTGWLLFTFTLEEETQGAFEDGMDLVLQLYISSGLLNEG